MTGLYPATSGVYFLNPDFRRSKVAAKCVPMPMRYEAEGYAVSGAGKIFHGKQNRRYLPNHAGSFGGFGPRPEEKLTSFPGHALWDWGAFPESDAQMPDSKIAAWAVQRLAQEFDDPFFLAIGFFRPHVPQYVPQKWFELHPAETLQLPRTLPGDLSDLPDYGIHLTRLEHVAPTHEWVVENKEWKPLVRSYLACVSFVDAQVGKVLDALDASARAADTFVVLYSDHGFHLGEKERWAKRSLWEDSTRVPLIVVGPGIEPGRVCRKPVELLDVYPTVLALTGHDADLAHEGQSLVPLLEDVDAEWLQLARTSFGPGNVSIRSERYRYVHYNDGTEEFYDHERDPHEWTNRIAEPGLETEIARHRAQLPRNYHPVLGKGSTGHKAFEASELRK